MDKARRDVITICDQGVKISADLEDANKDILMLRNEVTILHHQFDQLKDIIGAILKAYPALGEVLVHPGDTNVMETGTPQSNEPTPV
jgi:hypothetical protein